MPLRGNREVSKCNDNGFEMQTVRTYRTRMGETGEYEEAIMTVSYIEALVAGVILAGVVVGGIVYGICWLISKLIENHWEI